MQSNSKQPVLRKAPHTRMNLILAAICSAFSLATLQLPAPAQGGVQDNDFLPRSKSGKKREASAAPDFDGPPGFSGAGPGLAGPGSGPGPGSGFGFGSGPGAGAFPPGDGPGGPGFGGPPGGPGGQSPPGGFGRGPGRRHGMGPLDLSSLNLTEDQKSRIKAQRAKSAPRAKELMAAIRTKKAEMRDLMFDPTATGKQILDKRQELKALQDESETLMLNDFIAMRGVLTGEQLKHLPELKPGRGLAQRPGDGPPPAPEINAADTLHRPAAIKGDKSK